MRRIAVLFAIAVLAAACDRGEKKHDVPAVTPSADEVLEAYVTATGGRDAWAEVESMRVNGTFAVEKAGLKGTMTIVQQRPALSYMVMELKGMGRKQAGCDDTICWEKSDAEGVRILSGEELEEERRDKALDSSLRWREIYTRVENAGAVDFAGRPAWKIVKTPPTGSADIGYYDRETHLQLGDEKTSRSQSGESKFVTRVHGWKTFGSIKQPTAISASGEDGMEIRLDVERLEINPVLSVGQFELPPEVKALRDQAAEAPPTP